MKLKRSTAVILNSTTIFLSGLFTIINLSEWYKIKIQGLTEGYPFGGEGPTPYYYQSADLYSTVNLIWGIVFFTLFILSIWTTIKRKDKQALILFGVTIILIIGVFINGQIGVN